MSASIEITVRSGSVRVEVGDVPAPTVVHGQARIDADGVVDARASTSVRLACPPGTNVFAATASGSITCEGPLGSVRATTRSGDISVASCVDADLRTSSGKITLGTASGTCRAIGKSGRITVAAASVVDITTSSGDLRIGGVRDAHVHGGSGRVDVRCTEPGTVDLRTMSGNVTVEVIGGWTPATDFHTHARVKNQLAAPVTAGTLQVTTQSGRVEVRSP